MTDTLLPKKPLCDAAQAIPPSPLMLKHGNDYYSCSLCGEPTDDPGDTGLPKNDKQFEIQVMDLLGQVASWGYAMKGNVTKEEFMQEWINKGAIDNQEGASVFMELIHARDTKMLEQARIDENRRWQRLLLDREALNSLTKVNVIDYEKRIEELSKGESK